MTEFIIIVVCLILNGVLSGLEMAFVTVSKPHLKKLASEGSQAALRVLKLKANPERTLSVLQVGITLVGAISAAVSGAGAEEYLSPYFMEYLKVSEEVSESLAIATVVLPLTYFSVVVGELVPKTFALKFPVKLALAGGMFLLILDRIFAPFVLLLEHSTRFITKIIFSRFTNKEIVDTTQEVDLDNLNENHKQVVFNLIGVDKRTVKDIMLPWNQVTTIKINDHHYKVLDMIKSSRHTRLPVVDNEGHIKGMLYTKEFVSETEITKLDWTTLIRKAEFLSPKESIINALKKMQNKKCHLAIIKQQEDLLGIVTIEDIFEEFIGDIYDEDDEPRKLLSANSKIRNQNFRLN
ncbi:MAG: hemolysin family protein [Pseudobdellovibrio sp.]